MQQKINPITKGFFIAGTDTGVGKTYVAKHLLQHLSSNGYRTVGLKPVASGCEYIGGQLINDDAIQLQQAASIALPYQSVNPFAFEPAIAPHLAAKAIQSNLTVNQLIKKCQKAFNQTADYLTRTRNFLLPRV